MFSDYSKLEIHQNVSSKGSDNQLISRLTVNLGVITTQVCFIPWIMSLSSADKQWNQSSSLESSKVRYGWALIRSNTDLWKEETTRNKLLRLTGVLSCLDKRGYTCRPGPLTSAEPTSCSPLWMQKTNKCMSISLNTAQSNTCSVAPGVAGQTEQEGSLIDANKGLTCGQRIVEVVHEPRQQRHPHSRVRQPERRELVWEHKWESRTRRWGTNHGLSGKGQDLKPGQRHRYRKR